MPVPQNSFASLSPEDKAKRVNQLRNGNPNWQGRGGNPDGKNRHTKAVNDRKKLFSEVLREIYTGKGGPKRLKQLALVCIEYAEKGHARFAELILDRLEGPVKVADAPNNTFNFNFLSDGDRQRAIDSVRRIANMDAKTITLPQLPEESTCQIGELQPIQETSSSSETPDLKPLTIDS